MSPDLQLLEQPQRQFPVRITWFRQRAGLTQTALARQIGCSRETLNRIENGRMLLSESIEVRIVEALGLTIDENNQLLGLPGKPSTARDEPEQGTPRLLKVVGGTEQDNAGR